jgi:virginiamycin B lyase
MRSLKYTLVLLPVLLFSADDNKGKKARPAAEEIKAGVKTPGIQIPFASLTHEADLPLPGPPTSLTVAGDSIWVTVRSKGSLVQIEAKEGKAKDPLTDFKEPCSIIASAFNGLWIPTCGDNSLARFDSKTSTTVATLAIGASPARASIAATDDSIWIFADDKTTLTRVDPQENVAVSELRLPSACDSILWVESSLWVSCPAENKVLRVDPRTNLVDKRIDVAAQPTALVSGEASIWVWCRKDGKLDRIDPKTNKVSKSIELGVPGAEGDLAFGENSVWLSLPGFPITRIDPKSEKIVQQFVGAGGGWIEVAGGSVWLVNAGQAAIWRLDPKRIAATLPR